MTKAQAIFTRFIKGFVAAMGTNVIPLLITELNSGYNFSNSLDRSRFYVFVLSSPVLVGTILAVWKALTWVEPEKPIEIEEVQTTKTGSRTAKTAKKKTAARKTA